MKYKQSLLLLLTVIFLGIFSGCENMNHPVRHFVITSKWVGYQYTDSGLAHYYYNSSWEFIDSSNKYNVGDTLK